MPLGMKQYDTIESPAMRDWTKLRWLVVTVLVGASHGGCTSTPSSRVGQGSTTNDGRGHDGAASEPGQGGPSNSSDEVTGKMVKLAGGSFEMSSSDHDTPSGGVRITVGSFEMDVTEVTVAAYGACVKAGACRHNGSGPSCTYGKANMERRPINCVSGLEAETFCRWAGKRLPTEQEWEYAARGEDGRVYPWGNDAPGEQLCWKTTSKDGVPCVVGSFPANPSGLFDMAGNMEEWTSGNNTDPEIRNLRGGGWGRRDPSEVRVTTRRRFHQAFRDSYAGFRCAR